MVALYCVTSLQFSISIGAPFFTQNCQLKVQMKVSLESKQQEFKEIMAENSSRVRFLESKISLLESMFQSVQCSAIEARRQCNALGQKCMDMDQSYHCLEMRVSKQTEEAEMMEKNVKDLESVLEICKRRIVEQNGNNSHLLEKV